MPSRVLALFLAVVVLLAGFVAVEQAAGGPLFSAHQDLALLDAGQGGQGESIDDDRAGDLPAQPQAEGVHDLLLETRPAAVEPHLSEVLLHRRGFVALPSPFLEGPQRPPRPGSIAA
jgi:hypothetical protein